jgi:fucose permease
MNVTRSRFVAVGLWTIFFVNGVVLSSWAPRIPEVKQLLDLADSELGIALFGVAAGSVPALLLTARLLNRVRSAPVCVLTALVFSASLPLIGVAGDIWQLTAVLVVLGAASGVLDVAMNTFAITYQERTGHRVLSRLHGGYSLGVLTGAAGGVAATHVNATVTEHFVVVASFLGVAALACAPTLWPQDHGTGKRPAEDARTWPRTGRWRIPPKIAVLAVCGLLIEGLVTDWSALLISRDLGASNSLAATALAGFSLAMFVSRSAGDAVLNRFAERRVLIAIAMVVAGLIMVGSLIAQPLAMVVAIGLTGLTMGPVFPVAVYRAGRSAPGQAAAMTARVSAIGYAAYLGGPPVVGFVADTIGLPVTFAAVALLGCTGIAFARHNPTARASNSATLQTPPTPPDQNEGHVCTQRRDWTRTASAQPLSKR